MKRLVKCICGSQSNFDGNFTAGKVYEVVVYDYCFTTKMHCLLIDDEGFEMWAEDDCFEAINFDMETGKLKEESKMKMVKCIVDSIKCYGDYDLGSCYLLVDEDDEGNIKVIDKNGRPYWEYNRHFVYQKAISECAVELGEEILPTHVAERQSKISKTIKIKYFPGAIKLKKISKGDWIDLYAAEDRYCLIGKLTMIPLGVAMELPEGYEAIVAPRSSTFKTWGIVQANSIGVIDNSYSGDNDQWYYPAICLKPAEGEHGVWIHKGDKICQFRIQENQPEIRFEEVDHLTGKDRGGFGSTSSR